MPRARVFLIGALLTCATAAGLWWTSRPSPAPAAPPPLRFTPATGPASPGASWPFHYTPTPIGLPAAAFDPPFVTHLQIVDLDQDGLPDVLYTEADTHQVHWIRQAPRGTFTDTPIGDPVLGPVHVATADLYGNGRLDVLVASMGQVFPTNDRLGSVVVLENLDNQTFTNRVLLADTARVSDVRAANFSNHADGRLDLVVGQFGYAQGEIRLMRNRGDWNFASTTLNQLSGTVHTPVADFNGDRRPDIAAVISQEWEEVHLFTNLGSGNFQESNLWGSTNEDYGSSGLAIADLNRDGRPDLLYSNGDGFDYPIPGGRPWHGVQWLENQGDGRFAYRRIGDMVGAYSPRAADLDGDGDMDVVAVSCFADWADPAAVSLRAWINDGRQRFTPVTLAHHPTHLVALDIGDLDGDGVPELVTGGMHAFPPVHNPNNITLWRRN